MIGEGGGMIQSDANKEHGQTPSQRPEHPLMAVSVGVLSQDGDHCRIGQGDGRRTEEFADDDQQKQQEERLLDVLRAVHDGRYDRLHPALVFFLFIVARVSYRYRRLSCVQSWNSNATTMTRYAEMFKSPSE